MKNIVLIGLFFAFCLPFPVHANAVITEVMWMGSDRSTADEWLEIAGTPCQSSDADCLLSPDHPTLISQWTVTSLDSKGVEKVIARFATGATIGSGQYLVIANWHADQSRLAAEAAITSTAISLPNSKLLLRLRNASGALMDEVDDGVGVPFAGDNPSGSGAKASMQRLHLDMSGTDKANWKTATTTRGFDPGPPIFGTPGFPNDGSDPPEFGPPPPPAPSEATFLHGYLTSGAILIGWQPSSADDLSGQKITVFSGSQQLFSQMLPATQATISVPVIISAPASTYHVLLQSFAAAGGISAGTGTEIKNLPGIFISEILPDPVGTDTEREWVEIANTETGTVDITGWSIAMSHSTKKFIFGSVVLAPQSFASLRRTQTGLILSNSGATLSLYDATGLLIDTFSYSHIPQGVSAGRIRSADLPRALCKPTEASANTTEDIDPQIIIQSGSRENYEKVSLNLGLTSDSDSIKSATCHWDFSDGFLSDSCNPPSHSIRNLGFHTIKVTISTYCGTTIERTLETRVLESGGGAKPLTAPAKAKLSQVAAAQTCQPQTFTGITITELKPIYTGKPAQDGWIELHNDSELPAPLCGWKVQTQTGSFVSLESMTIAPKGYALVSISSKSKQLRAESGSVALLAPHPLAAAGNLSWQAASGALTLRVQSLQYKKAKSTSSFAWSKAYRNFFWTTNQTPGHENDEYVLSVPPPGFGGSNGLQAAEVKVLSVINGDTFDVALPTGMRLKGMTRIRVRLIGIDAPEMFDSSEIIRLYARKSYKSLLDLIDNKNIVLQIDTKKIDSYGRTVAYGQFLDGHSIEQTMLNLGLAYTSLSFPFADEDSYQIAESKAREAGKGIWANKMLISYFSGLETKNRYAGTINSNNSNLLAYGRAEIGISEVYSNPLKDSLDCEWCSKEWIELENTSNETIDTSGWMVQLNTGKPKAINVESIVADSFGLIDISALKMHLANKGGTIQVLDSDKNIIAKAIFGASKSGQSIVYFTSQNRAESKNNNLENLRVCISDMPTPGKKNVCRQKEKATKPATVKKKTSSKAKKAPKTTKKKPVPKAFVKNELSEVEKLAKVGFVPQKRAKLPSLGSIITITSLIVMIIMFIFLACRLKRRVKRIDII